MEHVHSMCSTRACNPLFVQVYLGLQTGSVLCLDIRMSGPQAVRSMASLPTTQPVHSVVPLPLQLTAPAAGQPGAGEADGGQGQRALPEVLAASTAGVWGLGEGQLFPLAPQQHQVRAGPTWVWPTGRQWSGWVVRGWTVRTAGMRSMHHCKQHRI